MPKYFTKSAFTMSLECPRRLYYAYDKDGYANQDIDDEFLRSLLRVVSRWESLQSFVMELEQQIISRRWSRLMLSDRKGTVEPGKCEYC